MAIVRSCVVNLQQAGRTIRMVPITAWRRFRCTSARSA